MEARQGNSKRENLCCTHKVSRFVCPSFIVRVLNVMHLCLIISSWNRVQAIALDIKPQLTIHLEL